MLYSLKIYMKITILLKKGRNLTFNTIFYIFFIIFCKIKKNYIVMKKKSKVLFRDLTLVNVFTKLKSKHLRIKYKKYIFYFI